LKKIGSSGRTRTYNSLVNSCNRGANLARARWPVTRSCRFAAGGHFGDSELAIGAGRNYPLTRLKTKLPAIELYRDDVGLERHQAGDAADLGIGVTIRPCRQMCVTDIVVAAYPFVRAEGLVVHRSQCGLINIGTFNVPPRRK